MSLSNNATLNITAGTNTIADFQLKKGSANISGGTNNITRLLNSANLTIATNTNKIAESILNYGTLDLQNGAKILLDSATFSNFGTIKGAGEISGGIFQHYGKFERFLAVNLAQILRFVILSIYPSHQMTICRI